AMLHLDALPGDPAFRKEDTMDRVVAHAREDLRALQDGGVDGILFSNEFSLPYRRQMQMITPAAMAYVIGELKEEIRLPFGVDCISDGLATIELAAAVEADFIRGTFCGCYVGDGGFYNNDYAKLLRRKAALGLDDLKMFYFLNPESDMSLDTRPLPDVAESLVYAVRPDALCISANAAGADVNEVVMARVKAAVGDSAAVVCNTGCRPDTIKAKLSHSDAAVVGTTFKKDGKFENHVEQARVEAFMAVVREFRAERKRTAAEPAANRNAELQKGVAK
ncbi:MAG: BtpA/SgcQ family protein, partial [Firmicutes bacterium]|nr:BtpA/SgcQ family protein [Bacillota bacterium]